MARYCRKCMIELPTNAAVCPECGHVVVDAGTAALTASSIIIGVILLVVGVPIMWFGGYFALCLFMAPKAAAIVVSILAVLVIAIVAGVWVSYRRAG